LGEAVSAKAFYHYVFLKDYDTALRYFEQASRLLPSDSRIPEALAFVERRRGQWEQSDAYFNRAERLDPRNVRTIGQHALLYKILRRFSPHFIREPTMAARSIHKFTRRFWSVGRHQSFAG